MTFKRSGSIHNCCQSSVRFLLDGVVLTTVDEAQLAPFGYEIVSFVMEDGREHFICPTEAPPVVGRLERFQVTLAPTERLSLGYAGASDLWSVVPPEGRLVAARAYRITPTEGEMAFPSAWLTACGTDWLVPTAGSIPVSPRPLSEYFMLEVAIDHDTSEAVQAYFAPRRP